MDNSNLISAIIGGLAGGGLVSAILVWATAQKRIVMENITQERSKWRATIRCKALEVHDAMIRGDIQRINRLQCEFRALLNPCDCEDKKIIESIDLCGVQPDKWLQKAKCFAKQVSWLLKHDWERAKLEAKPVIFRLKWLHNIPRSLSHKPKRYQFPHGSDNPETTAARAAYQILRKLPKWILSGQILRELIKWIPSVLLIFIPLALISLVLIPHLLSFANRLFCDNPLGLPCVDSWWICTRLQEVGKN